MMKARRFIISAVVLTGIVLSGQAQQAVSSVPGAPDSTAPDENFEQPSTDIYKKETIVPNKKPVPYPYVREADVMWAKDVWRTIDLRQRMNFPLRYPTQDNGVMSGGERYSLFGLLMKGIQTEQIQAYEYVPIVGWKDPFAKPIDLKTVYEKTGSAVLDSATNDVYIPVHTVQQFEIQEQWFFDKKHSVMDVRIIALAPVVYEENYSESGERLEDRISIPFFVHFPECRPLFATHAIYNARNDAQPISFDDLFFQRRFASTIIQESNVYGNRALNNFKTGQDILLEAEKIKNELFLMEHDLWEY